MPKLVYKCDFCEDFFDNKDEAEQHEKGCLADPRLRGCCSCYYKRWDYDDWICSVGKAVNIEDMCPEITNCPKWKAG